MTTIYVCMYACHTCICSIAGKRQQEFSPVDFLKLGLIVTGVSAFSFAPFVYFVSFGVDNAIFTELPLREAAWVLPILTHNH